LTPGVMVVPLAIRVLSPGTAAIGRVLRAACAL
jgi:hypothetical protein